jgi:arginine decarboxylase
VLQPGDTWHGFKGLEDGYCMLDPIKVSVVTPGVAVDGSFEKFGIPATLVTAYLDQRGVEVEKTTDFTILFLFSIGITKGKYATLINALLHFKQDYDTNAALREVLPRLVASSPLRYGRMGLHDLADEMFEQLKSSRQLAWQDKAFSMLPSPAFTPAETYSRLVHNEIEAVTLAGLANRVVATGIVPYPPGIPMLMPGENVGGEASPYLNYLRALEAWDRCFPGFGHDIHGVENEEGTYTVQCLT